jgi:hypothetical protein
MDEEDEWEYEYEESETEALVFTLDLTTHVPDAVDTGPTTRNGKRAVKDTPNGGFARNARGALDRGEVSDQISGELQVLDLHTTNPLIRFGNRVYSCQWHTDLGTQFHLSDEGVTSNPLWPGHVLDIVGTSQTRLLGRPVTVKPRQDAAEASAPVVRTPAADESALQASEVPRPEPTDLSRLRPGQQLVVPPDAIKTSHAAAQAAFFEKLSAIKLKNGENDIIPVGAVRQYSLPKDRLSGPPPPSVNTIALQPDHANGTASAVEDIRGTKRTHSQASATSSQMNGQDLEHNGTSRSTVSIPSLTKSPSIAAVPVRTPSSSAASYAMPHTFQSTPNSRGMISTNAMRPAIPWHALPRAHPSPSANQALTAVAGPSTPPLPQQGTPGPSGSTVNHAETPG